MIINRVKPGATVEECIRFVPDRNYNDSSYDLSWDKITQLGWRAEVPFEQGLDKVISWFLSIDINKHWPDLLCGQ
jgi:dTDP-D-glucose 4,6-dehydratase